ncbi:MAG: methionine-S-sulfoxide reductase [Parcubacteria group bacterium]|nr:methionine-S-sulfoxide reductase [Parcubacteria group bacterium]
MGCFWGPEAFYKTIPGVKDTTVGYTGGSLVDPTYEKVCGGDTGHAEAIEIMFDPAVVTYGQILDLFWEHHDPSAYHRQGPDVGEQYRAAIFYHGEGQRKEAEASKQRFVERHAFSKPVVTEISEAGVFYPAEEYHQDYSEKHSSYVCHI